MQNVIVEVKVIIDSRNAVLYFPKITPELAIRFKNVDDQVYFTESLHTFAQCVWISDVIPIPLMDFIKQIDVIDPLLYVFNLVSVKHMAGIKRGARVKSLAIASRHSWIHVYKVKFN